MILLLQIAVLRQKTSTHSLYGCLIGFAGVLLLVLPNLSVDVSSLWVIGCAVILIGECGYASGTLYSKKVITTFKEVSPIALNAAQMMYGGALMFILSLFTEHVQLDSMLSFKAAGSMLYLIVVGSMIGHSLYYWLVSKTNPVFPATWLYVSPPIAVGVGVLFYNEAVSWVTLLGVLTIITGTILVNGTALKQLILKPRLKAQLSRKL